MSLGEMLNRNPNPFSGNWPPMGMSVVPPQSQQTPASMGDIMSRLERLESFMGINEPEVPEDSLSAMLMELI